MRLFTKLLLLTAVGWLLVHCQKAPSLSVVETGEARANATSFAISTAAAPEPFIGVAFATRAAPTAVLIETTPSPLPPPTATLTPTPFVHIIEAGDTLLALALAHGTTVAEIEALNPGINARLLSVGQPVVLPPPATPIFQGGGATPIPIVVTADSLAIYTTPLGSQWVLGTLKNEGVFAAASVRVAVSMFGAGGVDLGERQAWAVPGVILPGQTAAFGFLVTEQIGEIEQASVAVIGGDSVVGMPEVEASAALTVADVVLTAEGEVARVTGRVQNNGQATVTTLALVLTLVDGQNKATGYGLYQLDERLPPGGRTSFSAEIVPVGGPAAAVSVALQAVALEN